MDKRKSNTKYDIDNLAELFGIQAVEKSAVLEKWLSSAATLTLEEKNMIETLRQRLIKSGSSWNEEELKIQFIGILFFIVNIDEEKIIKTFFERPMSAIVQNIPLSVIADCLIATPKGLGGSPREPYFFLQEAPSRPSPKGKEKKLRLENVEFLIIIKKAFRFTEMLFFM